MRVKGEGNLIQASNARLLESTANLVLIKVAEKSTHASQLVRHCASQLSALQDVRVCDIHLH